MKSTPLLAKRGRSAALAASAFAVLATGLPASAQDTMAEQRIRKIEAEVRALQRKVFPGGDQRFFEPEISGSAQPATTTGTAATTAVSDILARLEALETQLATLTGQIEVNSNRISQLEARMGEGLVTTSAPPGAMTTTATAAPAPATPAPAVATPAPSASQSNLDTMSGGASAAPSPAPAAAAAAAPTSARIAAVRAVEKPQTDDAADDEYSYGFRLWEADLQPEAQQQLKLFLDRYPSHWRASWGRNLLGRSYLDSGDAREAAKWFLQNYQADKQGGRAPDSLLYLAISMKRMDDEKRACIALAEFSESYASEAAGRLSSLYADARRGLDCG